MNKPDKLRQNRKTRKDKAYANKAKQVFDKKILAAISVIGAATMLGTSLVSNVNAVSDEGNSLLDALGIAPSYYGTIPTICERYAPDEQYCNGDDFVLIPEIYFDTEEDKTVQVQNNVAEAEEPSANETVSRNDETAAQNCSEVPDESSQSCAEDEADTCESNTTDTKNLSIDSKTDEDLYWLSRIIYAESRGESLQGKIAVGNVVINRVKSNNYPDTVYGVIFDTECGVQFTPAANGSIYNEPDEESIEAARRCLDGECVSDEIIYFINPELALNTWVSDNRNYVITIGNHEFYS